VTDTAVMDAPDVDAAFEAALNHDAQVQGPELHEPVMPAPPRNAPKDPEAPHGRDPVGKPLAPYGLKADGLPRVKPAGPGRPKTKDERRDEAPRTGTPGARDYREDLAGLGMTVWMGGAVLPATRPYAHLFKQSMPGMVNAWNIAAQKNPTVRGYVEKLAGDGSWAWVIGVCVSTAPFVGGCLELAKKGSADIRAHYAMACEAELNAFMKDQLDAAGLGEPEQEQAA
jgi:hypothetical protein